MREEEIRKIVRDVLIEEGLIVDIEKLQKKTEVVI